jgi:hypothetical protein
MSRKNEWQEDSEALSIAMDIVDKYEETFEHIDLERIRFLRILNKKNGKEVKVTSVSFPFNIDTPYLYYMEFDDEKWKVMDDAQRNLTVFSALYEVAPGGMDSESSSYGKKRPIDIKDYAAVIAAAGGRYDWKEVGSTGIHDILLSKEEEQGISYLLSEQEISDLLSEEIKF